MIAIAYLRVSTEDQTLGPEAQRAAIEAWAARAGAVVASWHLDQGVSGGAQLADRPGLLDAVAALGEAGAGSVLVVAKRDRLARDVIISAMVERECERAGGSVVSADGAGEGSGPEAQLMRRIIDAFAEYERALIRARTRSALRALKAKGMCAGEPPYGWRSSGSKAAGGEGRLVPNEEEQANIERLCELRDQGMTFSDVGLQLKFEGILTRRGKPFKAPQVFRIYKQFGKGKDKAAA